MKAASDESGDAAAAADWKLIEVLILEMRTVGLGTSSCWMMCSRSDESDAGNLETIKMESRDGSS